MTRETKVGMLVGLGVILLVGIIVSDHLSVAQKQDGPKQITELAAKSQDGLVAKGDGSPAINPDARNVAIPLPGEKPQQTTPAVDSNPGPAQGNEHKLVMNGGANTNIPVSNTGGNVPILTAGGPMKIADAADAGQTHIVKQGDSLYGLAKLYYKSGAPSQIALIRDANKSSIGKGDALKLGQKLVIPTQAPKATPAPVEATAVAGAGSKPVPTGVGVAPLKPETAVKSDGIFAATSSNTVTVEKGQTLGIIAAKYLGSANRWNEIKELNKGIDPNNLKVGSKLVLPSAKADAESKSTKPTAAAATVQTGQIASASTPVSPLAPTITRTTPTPAMLPASGSSLPTPATPIASAVKPNI